MKTLLHRVGERTDLPGTMVLTIVLWMCSLVVVGVFVLPLFGRAAAGMTALGLLVLWLGLCWGICMNDVARGGRR